jgi:hypothetical protein
MSSEATAAPALPWLRAGAVGVLLGGAVVLAGWASANGWWHLGELGAAVALAGAAAWLLRGRSSGSWTGTVVCALAFLVVAIGATPGGRWIYVGLGVVTAALTAGLLRRQPVR